MARGADVADVFIGWARGMMRKPTSATAAFCPRPCAIFSSGTVRPCIYYARIFIYTCVYRFPSSAASPFSFRCDARKSLFYGKQHCSLRNSATRSIRARIVRVVYTYITVHIIYTLANNMNVYIYTVVLVKTSSRQWRAARRVYTKQHNNNNNKTNAAREQYQNR